MFKIITPGKLILATCLVAMSVPAHAESARERFKRIDTNGDRALQFSEIYAVRATAFDTQIDTNQNGFMDKAEYEQIQARASERGGSDAFAAFPDPATLDVNADGLISRDEFVTHIPERIRSADRNGDQTLVRSELRALR